MFDKEHDCCDSEPAPAPDPEPAHSCCHGTGQGGAAAAARKHLDLAPGQTAWICPMCPSVREAEPVPCSMCGMALEPEAIAGPTVRYTCPMHPEVDQAEPGACPLCGMALEPTMVMPEESNPELDDMQRRFWLSLLFTVPVFVVAMSEMIPGQPLQQAVSPRVLVWIQLVLATPVVLWAGKPFFERAWASLGNRSPNMFTLIGVGTGVAYLYSVVATLAPGLFPDAFRAEDGSVAVYFEAAAVIITLVLMGQVLELRARSRTSSAIKDLLGLAPATARRLREDGSEEDVAIDEFAGDGPSLKLVSGVVVGGSDRRATIP